MSCFNNQYAKNNLGVIYKTGKGVKPDISRSIEYFEEAIKQENDPAAKFNLAHIYFYEKAVKQDLSKSLKLLVEAKNDGTPYSFDFLCLVVANKYELLDEEEIAQEFECVDKKSGQSLVKRVINVIKNNRLNKERLNEDLKNINLVYYIYNIENLTQKDKIKTNDSRPEINYLFWEGLGNI